MTLDDFIKTLSYTHLSELHLGGEGMGEIPAENLPKLFTRIDAGVLALHARFALRKKTLTLMVYDEVTDYVLAPDFAVSSASLEPYKYIVDTVLNPFPNDILMITDVLDDDKIWQPINDANMCNSWYRKSFDTLTANNLKAGDLYTIRYNSVPPKIGFGRVDMKQVRVDIPRTLEEALLCYVAGHVYGNMSMEGAMTKSQHFLDMYENECKILEERNLLTLSESNTNINPKINGWP